jgi:hypothetical protein
MAIPVEHVAATLVAFLAQLKEGQCDAMHANGIDFEIGEDMEITVSVIAPSGLNSITRTTTQITGGRTDTTEQPDKLVTETSDAATNVTETGPASSTTTQTKVEPTQSVTRTSQAKRSQTIKEEVASVSETTDNQSSTQNGSRQASGGNEMNRTTTYETQ